MSGKFMNVKKVILPMLTVLIITSQLLGCSSVSKSEMQYLLEQGTEIELTIPTLKSEAGDSELLAAIEKAEDEDAAELLWKQLASLTSSPEIRKAWDDTLSITLTDTGKNGMLYVDQEGNNENNNTLRVALHNREFQKAIAEDSLYYTELTDAVLNNYSDIAAEDDSKALHIGINDYFNLLPGTEEGYANADTYLSRAQFMAMVMRSETPVSDTLTENSNFLVEVGASKYNIYAQEVADHAYLTIEDGSLDVNTYTKAMTRGEAVYLLMNKYFHDELQSIDTKNVTLADTKDAGNILTEKQASEHDADAYIALKYAIDHADDGAPTDIYKALCLASQKGIITSETLWDDSLTMSDAIQMLVQTLMQDPSMEEFNFKQGKVSGHEVNLEDESVEELTGVDSTGSDITLEEGDYIEPSEPEVPLEKPADYVEEERTTDDVLADLKDYYEQGIFTKEQYESLVQAATGGSSSSGSTYTQQPVPQAAQDMYNDPSDPNCSQRADNSIQYGQGDYSGLEHIRIN